MTNSPPRLRPTTPTRRIRSDGWTVPRQRQFLKSLAVTGSVERACAAADMTPASAYRLRMHPSGAAFAAAWADAMVACVASLREIAFDRAINGTIKPVYEDGEQVGRTAVHSERLLMFLLRNYDGQRAGGPHNAGAWPQKFLVDSFDSLRDVDVPEQECVENVETSDVPECT